MSKRIFQNKHLKGKKNLITAQVKWELYKPRVQNFQPYTLSKRPIISFFTSFWGFSGTGVIGHMSLNRSSISDEAAGLASAGFRGLDPSLPDTDPAPVAAWQIPDQWKHCKENWEKPCWLWQATKFMQESTYTENLPNHQQKLPLCHFQLGHPWKACQKGQQHNLSLEGGQLKQVLLLSLPRFVLSLKQPAAGIDTVFT